MSFRENENKKITQSFEMFSENDCLRAVVQTIMKNTCSNKKKQKFQEFMHGKVFSSKTAVLMLAISLTNHSAKVTIISAFRKACCRTLVNKLFLAGRITLSDLISKFCF